MEKSYNKIPKTSPKYICSNGLFLLDLTICKTARDTSHYGKLFVCNNKNHSIDTTMGIHLTSIDVNFFNTNLSDKLKIFVRLIGRKRWGSIESFGEDSVRACSESISTR
jgi:hypothetical protein